MTGKKVPFIIIAAFILGTVILIFIHFILSKNNKALIKANEILISEVRVNSQLKDLEISIIKIESRVRGEIIRNNNADINSLNSYVAQAEFIIDQLQKIRDDDSTGFYVDVLDSLSRHNVIYSRQILHTLHLHDILGAQKLYHNVYDHKLTDSILITLNKIEMRRKGNFDKANNAIKERSKNAQTFITILIVFVLMGGAILFWFIINTIRRQGLLIKQLNVSEKKERESAAVKEKFLANMSHEIRTPLNAILGFANLLHRKEIDKESTEFVGAIQRSGENLLTIVNDILDLSKIESGMLRIEVFPFSIRRLVQDVEVMFSEKSAEKEIQFSSFVDPKIPDSLLGDSARLTQMLVNLIGNAIKFTDKGNVTLHIKCGEINNNSINVIFEITDTGIGIEEEKLDVIFNRFQQADDAVTRKFGGTGLGLAIVSDLVQLHNGRIEVESKLGEGSVFRLFLPFKLADNNSNQPNPAFAATDLPSLKEAKILLVEDNEINRNLMGHIFKTWNVSYDMAANGIEALEKVQSGIYDLILMDIQMPEMDGYTAAKEIRDTLKIDVPIIAMTAHAYGGEREKCLSYGMNEYISKPVREKELYNIVVQFTQNKKNRQAQLNPSKVISTGGFSCINLEYLQQISAGNSAFEKTITRQFIEQIPTEVNELENAWKNNDIPRLKSVAHNMKTTISVMGLNEKLQSQLDALENETLSEEDFRQNLHTIKKVCTEAFTEAKRFYSSL